MNNRLAQLRLSLRSPKFGEVELLSGILESCGIPPYEIVETRLGKQVQLSVYFESIAKARNLHRRISRWHLHQTRSFIKIIGPRDWRDRWKKDVRPFALTRRLMVVPAWFKGKYRLGQRQRIWLDTTLSFGTGLHETTRFMAQFIESRRGDFKSFLDVGTGTGLLALVAAHCGAESITAVDCDPLSIVAAKKNISKNRVPKIRVLKEDFDKFAPVKKFDFVAANLTSADLVRFRKKLLGRVAASGYLAMSGISRENRRRVFAAFHSPCLRRVKIVLGKKWIAVLYQRREGG